MVLRYSIDGHPFRLPPYSEAELAEMRRPLDNPLSATSRTAVLRRRGKTKSRQRCCRQIFPPSVSSPEPIERPWTTFAYVASKRSSRYCCAK
jgi:hypothetical protein